MSAKARDGQGRWRCKTIGVRISPEENAELDALVALSGMTKQDYCISRMLQRDVTVIGNPRVYKALRNEMEKLCGELARLKSAGDAAGDIGSFGIHRANLRRDVQLRRNRNV